MRKQNCSPTLLSLDGTMRLSGFGDCDIAGETTAYSQICNPGDCQKLEDLVAQKQRELRPRCKCTGETQCSFLPIVENERPEQTLVPPKNFSICHRQHVEVHLPPWPNPNLARRAARRRKPYRQPTLPVSTIPGLDSFVFGSPDQNRDRSQRRASPESVNTLARFFRNASAEFPAPATVRARRREHRVVNLRPRRRHAQSVSERR
jgi:hypothetical protein